MTKLVILVADQEHARLYRAGSLLETPREIVDFANTIGAYLDQEFTNRNPGQGRAPKGINPHMTGSEQAIGQHNIDMFAKLVATELESALQNAKQTQLYIIASPKFLGALRSKLSENVQKYVAGELSKDITDIPATELNRYVREMSSTHA